MSDASDDIMERLQPTEPTRSSKDRTKGLVIASLVITSVLVIMVIVVLRNQGDDPKVSDTQAITDLLEQGQKNADLTGCRSTFSALLLGGPQAVALKALSDYGVDSSEYRAAAARLQPDEFTRLVALSVSDPDEFLQLCNDGNPKITEPKVPVNEAGDVPYTSCGAAALAGVKRLTEADPGWNPQLDRDGDGVACE